MEEERISQLVLKGSIHTCMYIGSDLLMKAFISATILNYHSISLFFILIALSLPLSILCLFILSVLIFDMWVTKWLWREGSEQLTHAHTPGCQPTPLDHGKPPDHPRYTTGGWAGLDLSLVCGRGSEVLQAHQQQYPVTQTVMLPHADHH